MKNLYVTITGTKYYYGMTPFKIGKSSPVKKSPPIRMTTRLLRLR